MFLNRENEQEEQIGVVKKSMVHHQNQNGFTWKRTKETPCITVRYKFVTTKGQRGCRKYVSTKHSWFFYFDEKPDISSFKDTLQVPVNKLPLTTTDDCTSSQTARAFPAFSVFGQIGKEFTQWLKKRTRSSTNS